MLRHMSDRYFGEINFMEDILKCICEFLSEKELIQASRISRSWAIACRPRLWYQMQIFVQYNQYSKPLKIKRKLCLLFNRKECGISSVWAKQINSATLEHVREIRFSFSEDSFPSKQQIEEVEDELNTFYTFVFQKVHQLFPKINSVILEHVGSLAPLVYALSDSLLSLFAEKFMTKRSIYSLNFKFGIVSRATSIGTNSWPLIQFPMLQWLNLISPQKNIRSLKVHLSNKPPIGVVQVWKLVNSFVAAFPKLTKLYFSATIDPDIPEEPLSTFLSSINMKCVSFALLRSFRGKQGIDYIVSHLPRWLSTFSELQKLTLYTSTPPENQELFFVKSSIEMPMLNCFDINFGSTPSTISASTISNSSDYKNHFIKCTASFPYLRVLAIKHSNVSRGFLQQWISSIATPGPQSNLRKLSIHNTSFSQDVLKPIFDFHPNMTALSLCATDAELVQTANLNPSWMAQHAPPNLRSLMTTEFTRMPVEVFMVQIRERCHRFWDLEDYGSLTALEERIDPSFAVSFGR